MKRFAGRVMGVAAPAAVLVLLGLGRAPTPGEAVSPTPGEAVSPTPGEALSPAAGEAVSPAPHAADEAYVVLVRHAEKQGGDDPDLTGAGRERAAALAHALAEWPIEAIYVSQYLRTRATAGPLAELFDLAPIRVDAADVEGLARRIETERRRAVVVIGHSNTVPDLIAALGAGTLPQIREDQYDDLFVVRLPSEGDAHLLHLQYGAPSPG